MLGNLRQIVIANWDNFSDIIPNQAWLMSRMDAHVIAAAIQNAVNVDIATLHTVKYHIIAADKKTIVCSYICNGG